MEPPVDDGDALAPDERACEHVEDVLGVSTALRLPLCVGVAVREGVLVSVDVPV